MQFCANLRSALSAARELLRRQSSRLPRRNLLPALPTRNGSSNAGFGLMDSKPRFKFAVTTNQCLWPRSVFVILKRKTGSAPVESNWLRVLSWLGDDACSRETLREHPPSERACV